MAARTAAAANADGIALPRLRGPASRGGPPAPPACRVDGPALVAGVIGHRRGGRSTVPAGCGCRREHQSIGPESRVRSRRGVASGRARCLSAGDIHGLLLHPESNRPADSPRSKCSGRLHRVRPQDPLGHCSLRVRQEHHGPRLAAATKAAVAFSPSSDLGARSAGNCRDGMGLPQLHGRLLPTARRRQVSASSELRQSPGRNSGVHASCRCVISRPATTKTNCSCSSALSSQSW